MFRHFKTSFVAASIVGAVSLVGQMASAAAFTPGNLVVYRVGDGISALSANGSAVFLDEYTPGGAFVQSIPVATADNGANHSLIASGISSLEGSLTRSADGQYLTFTGYDATLGGGMGLANTTSNTVGRTVGIVDCTGVVNTTTRLTDFASGGVPRTAVTTDGSKIWVGGDGGVRYTTVGSQASTQITDYFAPSISQLGSFGGQLYYSAGTGGGSVFGKVGTGEPQISEATLTSMLNMGSADTPYAFTFADLSPTEGLSIGGFDTIYVAAENGGASHGGGISKFSLQGGTWVLNGTILAGDVRGLTISVVGDDVAIYGTTGATTAEGGGSIYSYLDTTGYNGTVNGTATTIATAGSNTAFRGIAFAPAPIPEPSTWVALMGGVGMLLIGQRGLRRHRKG